MKFSIRDIQTDFSLHDLSSKELVNFLLNKKVITEQKISTLALKLSELTIGKGLKVKWYSITRIE
jgi:hypothetical protein